MKRHRRSLPHVEKLQRYAHDVIRGRVAACKWVRAACARHIADLKRAGFPYRFDPVAAERICAFAELLPHVKGEWAKRHELIHLEPWECFVLGVSFGWKRIADDRRRFRELYIAVPRKNGKSLLSAVIGNYMLIADDEMAAEIYAGATTEKQAWEVFGPAQAMLRNSPDIIADAGVEVLARSMICDATWSKFQPVIGNPGYGPSPSCAIVDEFHEHATSALYDTMITGMGARSQPLLLITTTAGSNLAGPCRDKQDEVQKVLDSVLENEALFGIIYTLDEGEDWADPLVIRKANPNFGVSVNAEFLESQQRQAVLNPQYQNRFKTMHLNVWCNVAAAGINMHLWHLAADQALKIEEFAGEEAWFILDLASKIDICAFVQIFHRELDGAHHWYVFGRYYLPEDAIERDISPAERGNQSAYRRWVIQGHLLTTEGAELDFDRVRDDLFALKSVVQAKEIVYDPWRATYLAHQLSAAGATCVEFPSNGIQLMAAAYDELNAALASGRLHHDGNPVLAWMASNTIARQATRGMVIPGKDKTKPAQKIDGIVALCMGLARAAPQQKLPSVYETRGVISL